VLQFSHEFKNRNRRPRQRRKSTLFNALLKKQVAFAANYPFATIEPNIGVVPVPDRRLQKLAEITKEEEHSDKLPPLVPAVV